MTWTAPDFVDALASSIANHTDFGKIKDPAAKVFTYWPSVDESFSDDILIGYTVADGDDHAALGQGRKRQTTTLSCAVRVLRPGVGESVAKAARERAEELLDVVAQVVKNPPSAEGTQTIQALISARTMDQYPTFIQDSVEVRVCLVEFSIEYEARVP